MIRTHRVIFKSCRKIKFPVPRSPRRQLREAEQRRRLQCAGQPGRQQGDQPRRQLQERVGAAEGRGPGHHRDPLQVRQQQQSQCSDIKTKLAIVILCFKETVYPVKCFLYAVRIYCKKLSFLDFEVECNKTVFPNISTF